MENLPSSSPAFGEVGGQQHRIDVLSEYTPEVAADLGRLMHQLDESFSDEPVPQDKLEGIINSPDRDQIVAFDVQGRVVAAATMNTLLSIGSEEAIGQGRVSEGWLEDFVVDESARGGGIAGDMYAAMGDWCRARGLTQFSYGTETHRPAAIKFYERNGAIVERDAAGEPIIKHATIAVPDATEPLLELPEFTDLTHQEAKSEDGERNQISVYDPRLDRLVGSVTLNTLRGAGKPPEGWFDNMAIDADYSVDDVSELMVTVASNWYQARGMQQFSFAVDGRFMLYEALLEQGAITDEEAFHYTQPVETAV